MKKVLLATRPITPPWDEASKNFAYFLARTVTSHKLHLLGSHEPLSGLPDSAIVKPIFSSHHFNLTSKFQLFHYLRKARHDFDVTHYLFTPTTFNTSVIKKLAFPTKGKTLQTVATLRSDLFTPEELKAMLFADRITVYTDATKAKLNALGFTNVERIYPGIDLNLYQPREKSAAVMETYNLKPDDFIIVYPGEYVRLGATDFLTEALIEYFQAHPDSNVKFFFACRIKNEADRTKREAVREAFRSAGVLEHIRFEENDATKNMPEVFNTADVVAFPVGDLKGKFDVPLIIIEAYASGKPVILSDLEAFQEFSNPEISATIPKLNKQAFIDKILYLKQNISEREAMGKAGRVYAEAYFDLRETARHYSALYDSI